MRGAAYTCTTASVTTAGSGASPTGSRLAVRQSAAVHACQAPYAPNNPANASDVPEGHSPAARRLPAARHGHPGGARRPLVAQGPRCHSIHWIRSAPTPTLRRYHYPARDISRRRWSRHDRKATIRTDRTLEHGDDIRRGGAQERDPGSRGPRPRPPPRVRRQPHRHGGPLRRRGAPDRTLDARPSTRLLSGDEDRRAHPFRRPRRDPPLPRPPSGRLGRSASAPLPRPSRGLGDRDGAGRRARSRRRGASGGSDPLHRG